jgi:hypothetical protein
LKITRDKSNIPGALGDIILNNELYWVHMGIYPSSWCCTAVSDDDSMRRYWLHIVGGRILLDCIQDNTIGEFLNRLMPYVDSYNEQVEDTINNLRVDVIWNTTSYIRLNTSISLSFSVRDETFQILIKKSFGSLCTKEIEKILVASAVTSRTGKKIHITRYEKGSWYTYCGCMMCNFNLQIDGNFCKWCIKLFTKRLANFYNYLEDAVRCRMSNSFPETTTMVTSNIKRGPGEVDVKIKSNSSNERIYTISIVDLKEGSWFAGRPFDTPGWLADKIVSMEFERSTSSVQCFINETENNLFETLT